MENITKLITSPIWWISAVIVAFLVNITASYAKPVLDRFIISWSKNRKERFNKQKEQDDAVVMYLIENPQRLVDIRTDATYTALRIIIALSLAVFFTSLIRFVEKYFWMFEFSDILLVAIYLFCIILALKQFNRYRGLRRIIDKCSKSIYSYDKMPIDVVEGLREEDKRT